MTPRPAPVRRNIAERIARTFRASIVKGKLDLLKLDYLRSELENTFIRLVGGTDASN